MGVSPQDQEDQLHLGVKIVTDAFHNKMHSLEQEIRGLRMTCEEHRANVATFQKKNSVLEVELVDCHQRSQALADENRELFKTVNTLQKQISRLEGLKQAVMSSIQNDHAHEAELGDTRALLSEEFLRDATPLTTAEMGYYPIAPAAAPQPAPTMQQGAGAFREAPLSYDGAPQGNPAGTSRLSGGGAGAGGAAAGGSPVIDGKQFFRQARGRLSYEAFNLFLASIKRLNNQQQSRDETLEEARRIFGPELQDLYADFEALLSRHGM